MLKNPRSEQKPLKILFLLEDLCYGGTQMQNLELASRLDRSLFSPVILTLTGPTDLDGKAKKADVPLFHMGASRNVAPFFFLRLAAWLGKLKPDILLPCTALPNIWGRIWGKIQKIPLIIGTCRGGGAPARQHEKLLWRYCDGMVCNSRALVRDLVGLGVPEDRLRYVPNGVDTTRFKPAPKKFTADYCLITNVARLAGDKDQKTLLRAFALVAEQFPHIHLRLVGAGPEEGALKKFATNELSPAVAANVEFAGASADPAAHYAETDIFALSSVREGQPNAILEAMSCGLPICATNVGGIPAMLEENGLLSEPGDAQALADNILTFLRAPGMADHMGRVCRKMAEEMYSFDTMVQSHQELFLDLWQKGKNYVHAG